MKNIIATVGLVFMAWVMLSAGTHLIGMANIQAWLASLTEPLCKLSSSQVVFEARGANSNRNVMVYCPDEASECRVTRYYKDYGMVNYDWNTYLGTVAAGASQQFSFYSGDNDMSKVVSDRYVCKVECPDGSEAYKGECMAPTTTSYPPTTTTSVPPAQYDTCEEWCAATGCAVPTCDGYWTGNPVLGNCAWKCRTSMLQQLLDALMSLADSIVAVIVRLFR